MDYITFHICDVDVSRSGYETSLLNLCSASVVLVTKKNGNRSVDYCGILSFHGDGSRVLPVPTDTCAHVSMHASCIFSEA